MPGLDKKAIDEIDWAGAVQNILVDTRTDFILAPHLDVIFREKGDELIQQLRASLSSGTYECQLPVTMSVPKQGILTRPGSILLPQDRLIYQALVEDMLDKIESQFDRTIAFSHVPSNQAGVLFGPSFEGWNAFESKLTQICKENNFVLQCDIANYFETLPQHNLINALEGCGCRPESVRLLEKILSSFRQKNSQGIIQGVYPSDILGNFYLTDIDAKCRMADLDSARYVDDFYIGFEAENDALLFVSTLIEDLRKVGLILNSNKSKIVCSNELLFEHRAVDTLFDSARKEVEEARGFVEQGGYGFQGDWINSDDIEAALSEGIELELLAVRALLAYNTEIPALLEKIDRFCLPYLRAAGDESGIQRAFEGLARRPHLTRLYFSYLNHFARVNEDVRKDIETLIREDGFYLDYQRMYHMAGVLTCESVEQITVRHVLQWLDEKKIGAPTRALAAIFVSKFGTARDRRSVRAKYEDEDTYVRAAILFASQYFTTAEKATMRTAWKGHSTLNALIAAAL